VADLEHPLPEDLPGLMLERMRLERAVESVRVAVKARTVSVLVSGTFAVILISPVVAVAVIRSFAMTGVSVIATSVITVAGTLGLVGALGASLLRRNRERRELELERLRNRRRELERRVVALGGAQWTEQR
jgi:hypothetical protein